MEQEAVRIAPLRAYISVIQEPWMERNKLYPLEEVIIITILAVMALAQGWEGIERYGKAKKAWLSRFLNLKEGIPPPHDVYPPSRKPVLGDVPLPIPPRLGIRIIYMRRPC